MRQLLIAKLHEYLLQNNLDLLVQLHPSNNVSDYLSRKVDSIGSILDELIEAKNPVYIIEERCMDELTKDLRPSRWNYIASILEEEFETYYNQFKEDGILTYEVINLIEVCKPVFEAFSFTIETEDDRHLHYAIIGAVKDYLEVTVKGKK